MLLHAFVILINAGIVTQMADVSKFQTAMTIAYKNCFFLAGVLLLSACTLPNIKEDSCALANREATFSILAQNSMYNVYNACLREKRDAIVQEWRNE